MSGKIEWTVYCHYPVRPVSQVHGAKCCFLDFPACALHLSCNRNSHLGFHSRSFTARLPEGLTHILADGLGNRIGALANLVRISLKDCCALALRHSRPSVKCTACAFYSIMYVTGRRGSTFPSHITSCWTVILEYVSASTPPAPVNPDGVVHH